MVNTVPAISGFCGKAPLPPLNGIFFVIKSGSLLKSKYSLKVLTLTWANMHWVALTLAKKHWFLLCLQQPCSSPRIYRPSLKPERVLLLTGLLLLILSFGKMIFAAYHGSCYIFRVEINLYINRLRLWGVPPIYFMVRYGEKIRSDAQESVWYQTLF